MAQSKLITVYKASAGAGKTYTLAAEFIANLLNDFKTARQPHHHQLAITFTRKATTEMKERILENLYELAHNAEQMEDFLKVVRQKLVVQVSDREISLMAKTLLRQILHGYDRFHVTTIDAFFQSLLTNLAHELGLTATFKVDLNNDDLLSRGVEKMLKELQPNSQELQWVSTYIEQKMEESPDKSWRVEGALTTLAKELTKESYVKQRHLFQNVQLDNALAERYRKTIRAIKNTAVDEIKSCAKETHDFIEQTEGYGRISRGGDVEKYLHRGMNYSFSSNDPSKTALKIKKDPNAALKVADRGVYDAWAKQLSDRLSQFFAALDNSNFTINSCNLSLQNFNELRLLEAISASVQTLNTENDTFLLAYTPILFAEMVGNSDASFVFERAGTQYHHVMIDEFQDTSELQWRNLRNLFVENIAQGNSCMLVGDVKQGIYRWRGGDWTGLAEIKADYVTDVQTLGFNFRSGEKIVRFNNAVFVKMAAVIAQKKVGESEDDAKSAEASSDAAEESLLTQLYTQQLVEQKPVRKHGFVRIHIEKNEEKKDKASTKSKKQDVAADASNNASETADATSEGEDKNRAEKELREQILRLNAAGVPLDKMGILVRSNYEGGKIIEYFAQHALEHGGEEGYQRVDLVSDEAYLLSASRGVQLIVHALRYVHNATDEISLNYVLKHCPEENRAVLLATLSEWSKTSYQMLPFYDLVQRLIRLFNLHEQSGESPYIYTLLDNIVAFLDENVPDIGRFLQVWDESLHQKAVPSSVVKGVRILTIHKSKGLDFHSVFIPYCNWELESNEIKQPMIWATPKEVPFNEIPLLPIKLGKAAEKSIYRDDYLNEVNSQRIENLNLLYVAFTRARQNLVIFAPPVASGSKKSIVPALTKTIEELPWQEMFAGEVCMESDEQHLLLEISQPSNAECAPALSNDEKANAEMQPAPSGNPFKINAKTEEVHFETSTHDIRFRQSQQARLFNAALMEKAAAEEVQVLSEGGAKTSNLSPKTSELSAKISELSQKEPELFPELNAAPGGSSAPSAHNVADDAEFLAKREAAQRRGTLLHSLMEDIESQADVERVLQTALRDGRIAPIEEVSEVRKLLLRAMQHEVAREWFDGSWQLYRECTILTRDEAGNIHTPRPDRVMMRGEEAIVVDYKFGHPRPDYHEQVRHYCQLLQQMGKKHVKGYVWYVASGLVEAVEL